MSALASNHPCCPTCGGSVSPLDLLFDADAGVVTHGGGTARLTKSEARLFEVLANTYPRTALKDALYHALLDPRRLDGGPEPKIIDVMVCKIRKKLDPLGLVIITHWGVGYAIELPDGETAPHLRDRRYHETRFSKSSPKAEDIAEVRRLRRQGYPVTEIARRARLTFAAVGLAIDILDAEDRADLAARQAMEQAA